MNTLQVFGKGGFAKEVVCHLSNSVLHYLPRFFEFAKMAEANANCHTVIAIGDQHTRAEIAAKYKMRYVCIDFTGRSGYSAAEGTIICPGTIITTGVRIGRHCIVNLNCTIGHGAQIGDFVTLSPGVHVSGNVTIGKLCNIGTGTVIREGVTICDDVIIGAGAVIVKDITDPGTYICRQQLERIGE
jgi:sugar O-acyltransferase (sialic acid O-acetyltransferase NeuD family)